MRNRFKLSKQKGFCNRKHESELYLSLVDMADELRGNLINVSYKPVSQKLSHDGKKRTVPKRTLGLKGVGKRLMPYE